MNSVLQDLPMPVFGDGLQSRAFSHVSDVSPVIARAPEVEAARNQIFNIGADHPYTILELVEVIAETFGVPPRIEHLPARNEVVHAFSDHDKVREAFGLGEPVDLATGIGRMADWVRRHGPRPPVRFSGRIEIERNLPPSWR
jgi:UDP-glucose 4-epimerase